MAGPDSVTPSEKCHDLENRSIASFSENDTDTIVSRITTESPSLEFVHRYVDWLQVRWCCDKGSKSSQILRAPVRQHTDDTLVNVNGVVDLPCAMEAETKCDQFQAGHNVQTATLEDQTNLLPPRQVIFFVTQSVTALMAILQWLIYLTGSLSLYF